MTYDHLIRLIFRHFTNRIIKLLLVLWFRPTGQYSILRGGRIQDLLNVSR